MLGTHHEKSESILACETVICNLPFQAEWSAAEWTFVIHGFNYSPEWAVSSLSSDLNSVTAKSFDEMKLNPPELLDKLTVYVHYALYDFQLVRNSNK